ncbi:hypothetical protein BC829DRAFT_24439 [Chytridium lagenaria]|nr:hypothetical protein BC829DRAFT_24439 [Chytridium lagenaria]
MHPDPHTTITTTTEEMEVAVEDYASPVGPPTATETSTITHEDGTTVTTLIETYPDRVIRTTTTLAIIDGVESENVEIEEEVFETETIVIESEKKVRKAASKNIITTTTTTSDEAEQEKETQAKEAVIHVVAPSAEMMNNQRTETKTTWQGPKTRTFGVLRWMRMVLRRGMRRPLLMRRPRQPLLLLVKVVRRRLLRRLLNMCNSLRLLRVRRW